VTKKGDILQGFPNTVIRVATVTGSKTNTFN
jgi:hypothetical protein